MNLISLARITVATFFTISMFAGNATAQSSANNRVEGPGLAMSTIMSEEVWCSEHIGITVEFDKGLYPPGRYGEASGLFPESATKLVFVQPIAIYLQRLAGKCSEMRSADIRFLEFGQEDTSSQPIRTTRLTNYTLAGGQTSLLNKMEGMVSEPTTTCDRLGGLKSDPDLPIGVEGFSVYDEGWRPVDALDACLTALSAEGNERRFLVQAGRAMLYLGMFDQAFKFIERAHELGSPPAMGLLGTAYAEGWGVAVDLRRANILWRQDDWYQYRADLDLGAHVANANGIERPDSSLVGQELARIKAADDALLDFIVGLNVATSPKDASLTLCNRGQNDLRVAYISAIPLPNTPTTTRGFTGIDRGDCMNFSGLDHRTVIGVLAQRQSVSGGWEKVEYDVEGGNLPHKFSYICVPRNNKSFARSVQELVEAIPCRAGDIQHVPSFHVRIGSNNLTLDLN